MGSINIQTLIQNYCLIVNNKIIENSKLLLDLYAQGYEDKLKKLDTEIASVPQSVIIKDFKNLLINKKYDVLIKNYNTKFKELLTSLQELLMQQFNVSFAEIIRSKELTDHLNKLYPYRTPSTSITNYVTNIAQNKAKFDTYEQIFLLSTSDFINFRKYFPNQMNVSPSNEFAKNGFKILTTFRSYRAFQEKDIYTILGDNTVVLCALNTVAGKGLSKFSNSSEKQNLEKKYADEKWSLIKCSIQSG